MKKKRSFYIALLLIGICCIGTSLFLKSKDVRAVSGVLIGIGAGLFGVSISSLFIQHLESKNPELEKQKEIEYKDERNTMIRNRAKAKAKAGDITQWLIMAVAYITIIISAPLWITLVVVAVFLAYTVIAIYFMNKYQKEM